MYGELIKFRQFNFSFITYDMLFTWFDEKLSPFQLDFHSIKFGSINNYQESK